MVYPRPWRRQYGDEVRDLLQRQPLTLLVVVDVLRAAIWQRARSLTPGTLMGLGCIVLFFAGVVLTPTAYRTAESTALIRPSQMTFPTIKVTFFESEFFALLLVACGYWTQLRRGRGAARAAAWMTIVAGLPISAMGVFMLFGIATVQMSAAGLPDHPITPYALNMAIAPLLRAPESTLWGFVGGRIGRWFSSRRRPAHA
jgi:hypothetical protein